VLKLDIKNQIIDIKLDIKKGEIVAISGDSGAGKTTLLRVISGLEDAKGNIEADGEFWLKNSRSLHPRRRSVGFAMQNFALFENMTILDNLLYVENNLELANRLLESVDLIEFKDRYPKQLSGGQQQRVALCRAVVKRPKILLLDEPLSALHSKMRLKLQKEILKLHKEFNLTTIFVSHNITEIYNMANRVVELKRGRVVGDKLIEKEIYEQPFIYAEIVEKMESYGKYYIILKISDRLVKNSVEKDRFTRYNIGDFIKVEVKV